MNSNVTNPLSEREHKARRRAAVEYEHVRHTGDGKDTDETNLLKIDTPILSCLAPTAMLSFRNLK